MTIRRRRKPRLTNRRDAEPASGITPYLARFLAWSAARGYSERTVHLREVHLQRFIRWCGERSLDRPQDITRPAIERYRRHLYHYRKANGEALSFATQQQRLLPLRAFFKWLSKENYILSNPASELELPRLVRRLPAHILSPDDIEAVLAQTGVHGLVGLRDRAIIETLYSTGLRRAELANLKLHELDLKNGTLLVRQGKGGKDRYVPLGARAIAALKVYLDDVRPELVLDPDPGHVFIHEFGEPFEKGRLSDLVKRLLLAAGIQKPGACHLFRHAMATHMLENGADIRFIQAILGHAQLSTTEIYTHVSIAKLKEIHALTHPAERPNNNPLAQAATKEAQALLATLAAEDPESEPR
jgi:integrase/recombinase XerD